MATPIQRTPPVSPITQQGVAPGAAECRSTSQPPSPPASPWIKSRQLLQGTIPTTTQFHHEVRQHVSGATKMPYKSVAQREKFLCRLSEGRIGGHRLLGITDNSGHYQPDPEINYRFLKFLQRKNIQLDQVSLKLSISPYHINAKEFVDRVTPGIRAGKELKQAIHDAAKSAPPFAPSTHHFQETRIAVLAPDHKLYLGVDRRELHTHSVITSGGPVRWAGELITVHSNQPDVDEQEARDIFKAFGLK